MILFQIGDQVQATNWKTGETVVGIVTMNHNAMPDGSGWYVVRDASGQEHDILTRITRAA